MSESVRSHKRLARFSLVGAIGIGVQVLVLAMLTAIGMNYLPATILAVESAILHNFIWHQRFTWRDRSSVLARTLKRLLRFHLSNGLISLIGNMLLMTLFKGRLHLPILPANFLSISICALVNFAVSDRWVFAVGSHACSKQRYFSIAPSSTPARAAQREDK
jgi:putative flippase GtrA